MKKILKKLNGIGGSNSIQKPNYLSGKIIDGLNHFIKQTNNVCKDSLLSEKKYIDEGVNLKLHCLIYEKKYSFQLLLATAENILPSASKNITTNSYNSTSGFNSNFVIATHTH